MFASNENDDWIYLVKTPPVNTTILQPPRNRVQSDENMPLYRIELEQAQDDDITILSEESPTSLFEQNYDAKNEHENEPVLVQNVKSSCENDALNAAFELSKTSLSNKSESISFPPPDAARTQTCEIRQSTPKSHKDFSKTEPLISSTCLIILVSFSFLFGQMVTQWNQPNVNILARELMKTNQRLNEIKEIPIGKFEQKLTKQLEQKLKLMINEQLNFLSTIHDLQETLNKTKANMTNTITRLTKENSRLKEQVNFLKHRFSIIPNRPRLPSNSSSKVLENIFKQTAQSINLSSFFKHLSASVSHFIDHRHEYLRKSQEKLNHLVGLTSNRSLPFRRVKFTYPSWFQSRHRFARQWSFPSQQQRYSCSSKSSYPINKICSMKNWMIKFFDKY